MATNAEEQDAAVNGGAAPQAVAGEQGTDAAVEGDSVSDENKDAQLP